MPLQAKCNFNRCVLCVGGGGLRYKSKVEGEYTRGANCSVRSDNAQLTALSSRSGLSGSDDARLASASSISWGPSTLASRICKQARGH